MKINPSLFTITLSSEEFRKIQSHLEKCGAILCKDRQFNAMEEINKVAAILNLDLNYGYDFKLYQNGLEYGDFTIPNDGSQAYLKDGQSIGVKK